MYTLCNHHLDIAIALESSLMHLPLSVTVLEKLDNFMEKWT